MVGLDNFATGHKRNLDDVLAIHPDSKLQFRFIEGDITDLETCRGAAADVDYVLHQAALGSVPRSIKDPLASHAANVNGFLNVLVAARDAGARRVVYASSSSVYGDHPGLPKVEDRLGRALSPYAVTKRVDELYAQVFADTYEQSLVGLRYFNVFGRRQDPEGQYAAVIPRWIDALIGGRPCVIFGDGSNSRDFCYIDNVVQANLLAAVSAGTKAHPVGGFYNVGCNDKTDLLELYRLIRDALAADFPEIAKAEASHEPPRAGDVLHSQASIDKIVAALGYAPTHSIAEGMAETVAWFVKRRRRRA